MPLVTLAEANLAFGDALLLDHADLTLDAGERVALIGRNGSGKTTLLKVPASTLAAGFIAGSCTGNTFARSQTSPGSIVDVMET